MNADTFRLKIEELNNDWNFFDVMSQTVCGSSERRDFERQRDSIDRQIESLCRRVDMETFDDSGVGGEILCSSWKDYQENEKEVAS